jgi:hypothetical protein
MTDDRGVLGNLPRSRPGQRSEKRAGKTTRAQGTPATAGAGKPAAKASSRSTTRPKPAAAARRVAGSAAGEEQPVPRGGDPLGQAIRGVAGVAATGARIADGIARELLRRLPRP